jgi:hypothetical protein
LVACFAIWTGPAYIKVIGEFIREGRKNKVDVERKQALLKEEIRAIKDKRLSKSAHVVPKKCPGRVTSTPRLFLRETFQAKRKNVGRIPCVSYGKCL